MFGDDFNRAKKHRDVSAQNGPSADDVSTGSSFSELDRIKTRNNCVLQSGFFVECGDEPFKRKSSADRRGR